MASNSRMDAESVAAQPGQSPGRRADAHLMVAPSGTISATWRRSPPTSPNRGRAYGTSGRSKSRPRLHPVEAIVLSPGSSASAG
jgi:hypothetical protein